MLKNFRETDAKKVIEMKEQLESMKLENVHSLWYFVTSSGKKAIAGSKGWWERWDAVYYISISPFILES